MSDVLQLKRQYEYGVDMLHKHDYNNSEEDIGFSRSELGAFLWKNLLATLEKLEDRLKEIEHRLNKMEEKYGDK